MISYDNIQLTNEDDVEEPVSKDEAKAFAKVDFDDDDDLIEGMILSAREDISKETNLPLVESAISFNVESTLGSEKIKIPYGKGQISDLEILDEDEEALTEDDDYKIRGNMLFDLSKGFYTVSFSVVPTVPAAIKEAIKMLVAYRYNNRGDQEKQSGIPEDILYKISKYRDEWL